MLLKIIGFEGPSAASWKEQREQLVMAIFDAIPPPRWVALFDETVERSGGAIAKARPIVKKDRLAFMATQSSVNRLCELFRELLLDVDQQFAEWNLNRSAGGEGPPSTF